MPTYRYEALAPDGQIVTGETSGPTVPAVVSGFSARGYTVTKIEDTTPMPEPLRVSQPAPAQAPIYQEPIRRTAIPPQDNVIPVEDYKRSFFATNIWGPTLGTVPLTSLQFFFTQLGTMVNSGVPLVHALETLGNNSREPKLRHITLELKEAAAHGHAMSNPMQRYPEVFQPLVVSMVRAGEEGGFLDGALKRVAGYLSEEIELRNLYRKTTIYPKIVLAASVIIIGLANLIIASLGKPGAHTIAAPLNSITTWLWLAPLIIGIWLFLKIGLTIQSIRYQWDFVVGKIPFIGATMRGFAMAKFGRALAAMHEAGVALPKAVALASDACGNEYMRAQIHPVASKLGEGQALANVLRQTGVLSPVVLSMVTTGETTGNLEQMLTKVSEYYEEESKVKAVQMGHFVGAVCLGFAAVYVAYVIFNFFTSYGNDISNIANQANQASE